MSDTVRVPFTPPATVKPVKDSWLLMRPGKYDVFLPQSRATLERNRYGDVVAATMPRFIAEGL